MKKIKLRESDLERIIRRVVKEDADKDTPGGNPEYFYGDDSLDKLRKFAEEQDSEMSRQDIIDELIGIYSYSQDGAHDLVTNALEGLLYRLGGFRDDISGSNLNEQQRSLSATEEAGQFADEIKDMYLKDKTGYFKNTYPDLDLLWDTIYHMYREYLAFRDNRFNKDKVKEYDRMVNRLSTKIDLPTSEELLNDNNPQQKFYDKLKVLLLP